MKEVIVLAKHRKNETAAALTQKAANVLSAPAVMAVLVFLLICLCAEVTAPDTAVVLCLGALAAAVFGFRRLRERFSLPMTALTALALWSLIASLYARSGTLARLEIVKIAAAFSLTVLLLIFARGTEHRPGLWMASVLTGASALMSLISIDMLSTRLLSGLFQAVMGLFSGGYSTLEGLEAGVRMTSIIDNPNVFAGCAGIGVLLALGLSQGAETAKQKYFALTCLYLNALGFVLAFSMGGTAMIALAFAVYLLLERRQRCGSLLMRMIVTLMMTLIGAFAVSVTSLDAWEGFRIVPLLCALVGAAVLCLTDRFVLAPAAEKLQNSGKWFLTAVAAVLVIVIAFAAVACSVTGPVQLQSGETIRRAVRVTGDCRLEAVGADHVTVKVESQNQEQTVTHTSTELYTGPVADAVFAVPGDALVVWLEFTAQQDTVLQEVTCGTAEVPLNYPMLPDFVSNRLQGLWANENAIQRLAFFSDGLKVFAQSPVIGLGLGSFENNLFAVQSFYYESRHVHNHYIQLLADTGIIGLLLFLSLLGVSAWTVIRGLRRQDGHVLLPALGAALVFMAGHAAVEVVFSYYAYLPFAFGVFALAGLCGGQDVLPRVKAVTTAFTLGVMTVILAIMIPLMISTAAEDAAESRPTPQVMLEGAQKDPYCWSVYAFSYLQGASTQKQDPAYMEQADALALRLADLQDRTIRTKVAEYYFETGREAEAFSQLQQALRMNRSDAGIWAEAFELLETYESDTQTYAEGAAAIGTMLRQWMNESLTAVEVRQEWLDLLDRICPDYWEG